MNLKEFLLTESINISSKTRDDLMTLLAKIRQETGEKYRTEIERLYTELKNS